MYNNKNWEILMHKSDYSRCIKYKNYLRQRLYVTWIRHIGEGYFIHENHHIHEYAWTHTHTHKHMHTHTHARTQVRTHIYTHKTTQHNHHAQGQTNKHKQTKIQKQTNLHILVLLVNYILICPFKMRFDFRNKYRSWY